MSDISERVERAARNAGMLDAYLNISGVEDEAEALSMLRRDLDDLDTELAAGGLVVTTKERAAIGAAVERLSDAIAWTLRGGPDGSNTEAWNTQTGAVGSGDTIPEAISAALDPEAPTDDQ